jgi:uncharacterized protein YjbJ (UPF0337 family)
MIGTGFGTRITGLCAAVQLPQRALTTNATAMTDPKRQEAKGAWTQFKGRLREAFGALTDDEAERLKGRRDQLIGTLQEKTGQAREKIQQRVDQMAEEIGYRFKKKDE